MKNYIIYQDKDITITRAFIHSRHLFGGSETAPLRYITRAHVIRDQVGTYQPATPIFLVIGIATLWIGIGWLFFALAIAAWFTKIYRYTLALETHYSSSFGYIKLHSSKRKSGLKSLAITINGIILSNKVSTFAPT
jgi:Ammonium Transporter Family